MFNPTKQDLLRCAQGDEEDAKYWDAKGDHEMAARKREWAAAQRSAAANWSPVRYVLNFVNFPACGWALFAAPGGAIIGSIFDSGDHVHAQVGALIAAVAAYIYRSKQ